MNLEQHRTPAIPHMAIQPHNPDHERHLRDILTIATEIRNGIHNVQLGEDCFGTPRNTHYFQIRIEGDDDFRRTVYTVHSNLDQASRQTQSDHFTAQQIRDAIFQCIMDQWSQLRTLH